MDQEFILRVFKKGYKFGKINMILAAIRIHVATKSSSNSPVWENERLALKALYPEYSDTPTFIGKFLYRFLKIINGDYLRQYLFTKKWKNSSLMDFQKVYNAR